MLTLRLICWVRYQVVGFDTNFYCWILLQLGYHSNTHWIQYLSTVSFFPLGNVLKQGSGRPNISRIVQKFSKDIVQLTGLLYVVCRSLAFCNFYYSQGEHVYHSFVCLSLFMRLCTLVCCTFEFSANVQNTRPFNLHARAYGTSISYPHPPPLLKGGCDTPVFCCRNLRSLHRKGSKFCSPQ